MEKIIEIFEEYQTKHKSRYLLEYDLKNYLELRDSELRQQFDVFKYDEYDLDERYEEGRADGIEDGIESLLSNCRDNFKTFFNCETLEQLKDILLIDNSNFNNIETLDKIQAKLENIINDFISYSV